LVQKGELGRAFMQQDGRHPPLQCWRSGDLARLRSIGGMSVTSSGERRYESFGSRLEHPRAGRRPPEKEKRFGR